MRPHRSDGAGGERQHCPNARLYELHRLAGGDAAR